MEMNSTGMDQRAQSTRFWLVAALHFSGAVGQVEAVAIGDPGMHVRGNEGGALGSDVPQAAGQLHVADVVGGGGRAHFAGAAIQDLNGRRARREVDVVAREVASRVAQRVVETEGTRDRPQGPVDEAFREPDAPIRSPDRGAVIAQHGSHGLVMDLDAQRA
jgi:hypothetical protein